jgi:hypothetical protein
MAIRHGATRRHPQGAADRQGGVSLAFTSIRHALDQLAERHEVAASDDGKTWRYVGESA